MARQARRHADGSIEIEGRWIPDEATNPDRAEISREIAAGRVALSDAPPPPPPGEPPIKAIARAVALLAAGRPVPPALLSKIEAMEG